MVMLTISIFSRIFRPDKRSIKFDRPIIALAVVSNLKQTHKSKYYKSNLVLNKKIRQ